MLLDILLGIVAFWSGYKVGQKLILWPMRKLLERVARKEGKTVEQLINENYSLWAEEDELKPINEDGEEVLTIEKHETNYFAYGHTQGFLAQGSNIQKMMEALKERMPQASFVINKSELKLSQKEIDDVGHAINSVWGTSTNETL